MSQTAVRAAVLLLFITGFASSLPAQTDPEFVVTVNPSIVTITQGGTASLTVHIAVNERPSFEFSLSGLPSGVIAQVPAGHAGATTIVLTALPTAATGTFNVQLTTVASGFAPPRTSNGPQTQEFTVNVKPLPVTQWEYRVERARTAQELESTATNLGAQSWELVSVVLTERRGADEWVAFFKRQKHPHE
ncbi:MAG TPA: hypothetical protein VE054_11720 [Blattabacteriaceae bacterium]|nr:hypothetical protein [Blattabacteriaceae bacterium]